MGIITRLEYAKMEATQQPSTTTEPVGLCSCATHAFPEENDGCVNVRLRGFEQDPDSWCKQTCVSHSSFPSGDELVEVMPAHLTRKIQPSACSDISWRLNQHCQQYITGAKHMLITFLAIFCMFLLMLAVSVWNAAAAANAQEGEEDDGGPNWIFYPLLPLLFVLPTLFWSLWVVCVRNPQVDRSMEAECEALSSKTYKLSFTSCIVSLDRKPNPSNMLKYVTIRIVHDVC